MIGTQEVRDVFKVERKGVHSHITGLGLKEGLEPAHISDGMVGQEKARRAAALIVQMIKASRIAGRAVLISGEPGTGKTAIAVGISKSIGADTPFVSIAASEIFSLGVGKTEALYQALRKAIGVRIREETEILEGEVVRVETATSASGKNGKLTLKTVDMESDFTIGARLIESILKEHVQVGDVIQLDKSNGRISKAGRSIAATSDYDACGPSVRAVPCPSGEILKKVDKSHVVSLHEMDVINSRSHGFLAVFSGDTGEIPSEIRSQINKKVTEWQEENKADIVPGVLFIDEVHMLDLECFSFLNRAIESDLSPILIMATNKGEAKIRGTSIVSPHGIPIDLLDRCLIVKTEQYTNEECKEILKIRARDEGIEVDGTAMEVLSMICDRSSLRYAAMLVSLADVLRQKRKGPSVTKEDFSKCYRLFLDQKRVENSPAKDTGDFVSA